MNFNYQFNKESCPYYNVCKLSDSPECNAGCIRFLEMNYLLDSSGVPSSKRRPIPLVPEPIDLDGFKRLKTIKDDIINFVDNGCNLYLYSLIPGNGKTSWALKLLLRYFDLVWAGNGFTPRGLFINVPRFLRMVTENVQNPTDEFKSLKKLISEVDLVVWDDIGAIKLTDYDHKNLLSFIDQRLLAEKANIYTGNLPYDSLVTAIGQRLASRVYNDSSVIELFGQDRRGYYDRIAGSE